MLKEELKKLSQEEQPQSMEELFRTSKEGMMSDNVVAQINALLPQMRERMFDDLKTTLTSEIDRQVGAKRVSEIDMDTLLPKVKDRILDELREDAQTEIDKQVGAIRVRDGRDGEDGKTPTKQEIKGIIKEVVPKPKKEEFDVDKVKGLRPLLDNLSDRLSSIRTQRGASGGGSTMRVDDLSSQADGSTQSFTTTYKIGLAHALFYSAFPSVILPTTDYVASGNIVTISTLTPVSGQSLLFIYEEG